VFLDGEDVTNEIRTAEFAQAASRCDDCKGESARCEQQRARRWRRRDGGRASNCRFSPSRVKIFWIFANARGTALEEASGKKG